MSPRTSGKSMSITKKKIGTAAKAPSKNTGVYQLQESDSGSNSSSDCALHLVFNLEDQAESFCGLHAY